MNRLRLPTAVLGASALALVLALSASGVRLPSFELPPLGRSQPADGRHLHVAGVAVGLYPGGEGRLHVTVRNPNRFPVRVVSLRTSVRDAGRRCPARSLVADPLQRPVRVGGRGAAHVTVRVRMARNAPDACRDRRFPLRFVLRAVRA